MQVFTTGDVLRILGVARGAFDEWCAKGYVVALTGNRGTGNHRVFGFGQVVGLAVANQLRTAERGCALSYSAAVVDAFAKVDEQWLRAEFAKGRTHLALVHQGKPLLDGAKYDWPDVRAIVQAIEVDRRAVTKG